MENTMNNITQMEQPRSSSQKLPVILVLDTSGSMEGQGMADLNQGIQCLKTSILNDAKLQNMIELAIVTFNDDATLERKFDLVSDDTEMPCLSSGGLTNTVSGVNAALGEISARKAFYRTHGEQYYRPILFVMSDGASSNSSEELDALKSVLQTGLDSKAFSYVPVAVGDAADAAGLAKMSPTSTDERLRKLVRVVKLRDTKAFAQFFVFLSASVGAAAAERTGFAEAQLSPEVGSTLTFQLN
jgi:uncharacterized protein YegL